MLTKETPELVKQYNNAIRRSIKIQVANIEPDTYIGFPIKLNTKTQG